MDSHQARASSGPAAPRPSPPAASGGAYVPAPNPLSRLPHKGAVDVLDEADLRALLPETDVDALLSERARMRPVADDPRKTRMSEHRDIFEVTFRASLRDLLSFRCTRGELTDEGSPCLAYLRRDGRSLLPPDAERRDAMLNREAVVISSGCCFVENEFSDLLVEDVRLGASLADHFFDVQRLIEPTALHVRRHEERRSRGLLSYCAQAGRHGKPSERQKSSFGQTLAEEELIASSPLYFLRDETIDRGTILAARGRPARDGDVDGSDRGGGGGGEAGAAGSSEPCAYRYFPEEHGMAEAIKSDMAHLASLVRVFALRAGAEPEARTFFRCAEPAYQQAKRRLGQARQLAVGRQTRLADVRFWLGYKEQDEVWEDESERSRLEALPAEQLDRKRRVVLNVYIHWLSPRTAAAAAQPDGIASPAADDGDRFVAHAATCGVFVPGVPFVDALDPAASSSSSSTGGRAGDGARGAARSQKTDAARIPPDQLDKYLVARRRLREDIKKRSAGAATDRRPEKAEAEARKDLSREDAAEARYDATVDALAIAYRSALTTTDAPSA